MGGKKSVKKDKEFEEVKEFVEEYDIVNNIELIEDATELMEEDFGESGMA